MSETRAFLKSAGRNVVVQLVLKFLQYALLLVVQVFVARMLGKDGLGLYSYISSLAIPLWVAIEFGIDNYLVRELSASPARAHELCVRVTAPRLAWAALLLSMAFVGGVITLDSTDGVIGFGLLLFALLPRTLGSTYFSLLLSQQRYMHALRLDILGGFAFACSAAIVLPLTHSLIMLLACFAAIETAKGFVALHLYRTEVGSPLMRGLRFTWTDIRALAGVLAPFALVNVFISLQGRLDIIMLQAYRGVGDVGVFSAAERFVNASVALPSAVFNGLLPLLAVLSGKQFASKASTASLGVFTAIGLLISVCMFFGADTLIGLTFQFPESVTVLRILSWSFTFFMFNTVAESLLYGRRHERTVLWVRIVGLCLIVATNAYFAPRYGAAGTAVSTTITEFLTFLVLVVIVVRKRIIFFAPTIPAE